MRRSYPMALGGLMAALAVVVMSLGAMIPFATFCCPLLAMLLETFVLRICGKRVAWAWFAAVGILSVLLCPDPEAAALFAFLGYYPIIKWDLERIRLRPVRLVCKLAIFNAAVLTMYAVLIYVLQLEAVAKSILEEAPWLNALTLALGNITFLLADALLTRFTHIFQTKRTA